VVLRLVTGFAAVRVTVTARTVSVVDPMFPGVSRCLPVVPATTVAGMLAGVTGHVPETGWRFGWAFRSEGGGTDIETWQPVPFDGKANPVRGRSPNDSKGGAQAIRRPFLADCTLVVWVLTEDPDRVVAAFRRPVWPLRVGRSQDLGCVNEARPVTLTWVDQAVIGSAVVPGDEPGWPGAADLTLPAWLSQDRTRSRLSRFWWQPGGSTLTAAGLADDTGQGVWPVDYPA
jgi:CRISPR-associated Cas5-like protein